MDVATLYGTPRGTQHHVLHKCFTFFIREKDGGTRADFGPTHFDIGMSEDVYYSSKTSISVRVLDTAPLLNRIKSILGEGFCIIRESIPRLDEQFEITIPLTVADFPEKGHQAFQGYVKFRAELTSTANYFSLTRGIGQMPAPIPHELDANTVIQTYQAAYGFPMRTFSCIQGASVWVFLCPPGKSGVIPMGERREIFRTTVFLEKVPKPTIILSRDDDALMPDLETADQRVLPFTPLDVEVAVAQFIPELGLKFVGSKDTGGNTLEMMPKKKTIVCTGIHCRELMNVEAMGKNDPYVVLVLTNSGTREQTKVLDDHGSVADYEGLSMRFPLDNVPIEGKTKHCHFASVFLILFLPLVLSLSHLFIVFVAILFVGVPFLLLCWSLAYNSTLPQMPNSWSKCLTRTIIDPM